MSMKDYLKSCTWEWILGILVSWSLCQIFFHGFYIAETWQENYLCSILVMGILTAGCLIGAYDKRSIKIAVPSGIVALILVLVRVQQMSQSQNAFRDQEENAGIYFLILILTSLGVFFLSRTRIGNVILFVAGSFLASTIQFLYESSEAGWLILFLCSVGAMYLYKTYQKNVRENSTVMADFRRAFLTATVAGIVILLLSIGIFYGIVKPLNPPTHDLKLITKYMSLEVLEKTGVADTHILNDTDEKTDNVNEDENDSKKKGNKEDQTEGEKSKQEDQEKKDKAENPTKLDDMLNQFFYAIKYIAANITPMLLIPFLIFVILAVILIKILRRKRWLKKVLEKERRDQIIEFYEFYIKKFQKMKVRKAPEETPYEFAERSAPYLREFHVENTSFTELTDAFVKARYSEENVKEEDYQRYLMFYRVFYKNCREHLGTFKYILKFFTL